MEETEYPTLDFGSEVKETFTHIIALGEKANSKLSRLRADLGDKFEHDMLTIEEGSKYVRFLVAIVDESASFNELRTSYSHLLSKETILCIIDIAERPSVENGVSQSLTFGYLRKGNTTTLRIYWKVFKAMLSIMDFCALTSTIGDGASKAGIW